MRTFLWQHDTKKSWSSRIVSIWEWDNEKGPVPVIIKAEFSNRMPLQFVKEYLAMYGYISPAVHKPSGAKVFEDQNEARYFEL